MIPKISPLLQSVPNPQPVTWMIFIVPSALGSVSNRKIQRIGVTPALAGVLEENRFVPQNDWGLPLYGWEEEGGGGRV